MVDLSKAKVGDTAKFRCGGSAVIEKIHVGINSMGTCDVCLYYKNERFPTFYSNNGCFNGAIFSAFNITEIIQAPEPLPDVVQYCYAYDDSFGYLSANRNALAICIEGLALIKLTFNPNSKEVKAEVVE